MTPAQSNVVPGDSVFLRCSHTSTDRGASYAWERLDGMDMMATGRFEASGRSGEVLRITFAEEADSGVYVCRVTSSQGVQTGTAQVFVGKWDWGASCKGVFRISSTSLSHVVQSVLPLGAMAFFRTARQTSHGIRHLSLKVKLSHSLGKLVSATLRVLNLGPLRSYKARSFSNRLLRRGTDLLTVYV